MKNGQEYNPNGIDMVYVASSESITGFYIGKYEVTQIQWESVMGSNPSYFKGAILPVENVSWNDVNAFVDKLNAMTGKNYRLPTEKEWVFAAREGRKNSRYEYAGSNNIGKVAWYFANSGGTTHPVGQKKPNALGIYDMSGNVREWCADGEFGGTFELRSYKPILYYSNRGGSYGDESTSYCRVLISGGNLHPTYCNSLFGFRLVLPRSSDNNKDRLPSINIVRKYSEEDIKNMSFDEYHVVSANELLSAGFYPKQLYIELNGRIEPARVVSDFLIQLGLWNNGRCPGCWNFIKGSEYTSSNSGADICSNCYQKCRVIKNGNRLGKCLFLVVIIAFFVWLFWGQIKSI